MKKPLQISFCLLALMLLLGASSEANPLPASGDRSGSFHKAVDPPVYPAHLPGLLGLPMPGEVISYVRSSIYSSAENSQDRSAVQSPDETDLKRQVLLVQIGRKRTLSQRIKKLIFPFHTYL